MKLYLAPMEGVVDTHFRALYSHIGGLDACVSEFVRVNDLAVSEKALLRECPELVNGAYTANGLPVHLQLLGSNPDTLATSAVSACALGALSIDLNFGCPAKTVNNSKGGAVLLKQPELIGTIVRAVRAAVPKHIPVTAKMRLGFEDRSMYMDNAIAIAEAGADALCVHARSRADGYEPPAYWHCIADINKALTIPVIANGEIWSVADWLRCREQSLSSDFMLGRGLISQPDLALQIKAAARGQTLPPMAWREVCNLVYAFYQTTKAAYPERYLGNRVKQWLFYLQRNYPEAGNFFEQIKRCKSAAEFEQGFAQQGIELDAVAA